MSKKFPECPLSYTDACKEWENPKVCALVREDKICLRKFSDKRKPYSSKNSNEKKN